MVNRSAGSSEPLDLGPLSPQMEAGFHRTVRAKETPMAEYTGLTRMDVIKRTTGPETTNGSQWEVQLSVAPPPEWLEFFKQSGEAADSATSPRPQREGFRRAPGGIETHEDHDEA